MPLIKCKECGHEISKKADTCPNCGSINKKKRKLIGFWGILFLIILIGYFANLFVKEMELNKIAAENEKIADHFRELKESIITEIQSLIDKGHYPDAFVLINKYAYAKDEDLQSLHKITREKQILEIVKPLPARKVYDNLVFYKELLSLRPDNEKYKNKVAYYQKKVDALEAKVRDRNQCLTNALDNVELKFTWNKTGFGDIMEANFTVKNNNKCDIKDIKITCTHYAKSGTKIDSNRRAIYDVVPAGSTKTFNKFNMGFMHTQANSSSCRITDVTAF